MATACCIAGRKCVRPPSTCSSIYSTTSYVYTLQVTIQQANGPGWPTGRGKHELLPPEDVSPPAGEAGTRDCSCARTRAWTARKVLSGFGDVRWFTFDCQRQRRELHVSGCKGLVGAVEYNNDMTSRGQFGCIRGWMIHVCCCVICFQVVTHAEGRKWAISQDREIMHQTPSMETCAHAPLIVAFPS